MHPVQTEAAPSTCRILVVEDEGLVAHDIESRLRKAGYQVVGIVGSGEEALESVDRIHPDLILMDIRLSGRLDGIETAALVQVRYGLPIVYLTAHSDRETLERAKITGPFGYITKPIGHGSLTSAIEIALYKHETERELRQQRGWLRTILHTMSAGVIVTNNTGLIQYLNPVAEELTGWSAEHACNERIATVLKLYDPQTGSEFDDLLPATIVEGGRSSFPPNLRLMRADGGSSLVEGETAWSTEDGVAVGAVITIRDVTRREYEEQQRRREQRMQAVGRLATVVAHDFNNLLSVILGVPDVLTNAGQPLDEPVRRALEQIKEAASSAGSLTRRLLDFTRGQFAERRLVDVNTVLQHHEELCRRSLPSVIVSEMAFAPGLRPVWADPDELVQVLINLVLNARDAMPDGGTLRVWTEGATINNQDEEGDRSREFVLLAVSDTGMGMDASLVRQIFEPFFTTKSGGTGLGLYIVQSIVNGLGGWVTVVSRPREGSTFRVFLPTEAPNRSSESPLQADPKRPELPQEHN